ncbi:MAG: MFS transporter [Muribaculaceae bacterium]|nr:MFS transporter [Muribaculaceae bacterium]
MASFLAPPAAKPEQTGPEADAKYRALRWQVFSGAFIGYAAFYIVRKNLSMAIPSITELTNGAITKGDLGVVLAMNAVAYAFAKFVMATVSDRSNARRFLPLGLVLSALAMAFMMVPIAGLDIAHNPGNKTWAILLMGVLNFLVGWFNGMGWPPCGRVMTQWFSQSERGIWMSFWNCAHNVGGGLVGPMATYGAMWFGSWFFGADKSLYFLAGTFIFPAAVAMFVAVLAYCLLRDNPRSCGLPTVEKWRNDYPKNYTEKSEEVISTKEILFKHVLNNKLLWFVALANAFVYMVRYGALDWAPTILTDKGISLEDAGWAYFAFEYAAIPGTIICGWVSDKLFKGQRAMPTILFMALVAIFIVVYWFSGSNITLNLVGLVGIGFFIYGPVMLIGVQALELVPKNAAGTAAGLTGFFGYFFGTAILANTVLGLVPKENMDLTFILLLAACGLSVLLMAFTYGEEKKNLKKD